MHTVSGSMVRDLPFRVLTARLQPTERSGGAGPRILWLGRNGPSDTAQCWRLPPYFPWLLSLLVLRACWAPGTGSAQPSAAVVRRHCRAGRGRGSPWGGAHLSPASSLLTGPQRCTGPKAHWRKGLPGTQGAQGNLGELGSRV